jgi:lysyl-tRNA synthetase class II
MKPPVNIEDLMEMWSKDSSIDETEPAREMIKTPNLHAKYLRIMTHHNLIVKKLMSDYNKRKKIKWEYYSGDLNNPEDLEAYKLEPMVKKVLRADIGMYLDSDKDLNDILLKKIMHEEIVEFCKTVLKELNNRTWQLKSVIDWEKFTSGG